MGPNFSKSQSAVFIASILGVAAAVFKKGGVNNNGGLSVNCQRNIFRTTRLGSQGNTP